MKSVLALLSLALVCQAVPSPLGLYSRAEEPLIACLKAAKVSYVNDNSTNWKTAIQPYNLRVPITPAAIAYPNTTAGIQAALSCGIENDFKVSAKSGGHSYGSYGLGGENGHFVIQLDRMYGVTLRDDNTAVVNAGTRLGVVALELYNQGKRAISHGTCPSVGVGGHVSHGGFGFSSHTHGLAVDAVIGASVILANGTLLHTSATENPDIFWAIKGAGSSVGIVTQFEFNTWEAPKEISWFSIRAKVASRNRTEAIDSMMKFQDIIESGGMDRKLNMRLSMGSTDTLEAVYHGSLKEGRAALGVFNESLGLDWATRPSQNNGTWLGMLNAWTYGDPLNITTTYNGHDTGYTSSMMTKHIPRKAMAAFVDYWKAAKSTGFWWLQLDIHGDPNGAIAEVAQDATSYAHRDKLFLLQIASPLGFGVDEEDAIEFVNGFADSLKDNLPAGDWGRYFNYLDTQLTQAEAQQQYWMSHLPRLQSIKAQLDPNEVFYNPQSIQPAK